MKNFKKIALIGVFGLLSTTANIEGGIVSSIIKKRLFSPTITAATTYPFFSYLSEVLPGQGIEHLYIPLTAASLAYATPLLKNIYHIGLEYEKQNYMPLDCTLQQQKQIEERFNKYRPCNELTILEMKEKSYSTASVLIAESKCNLKLPSDFFEKYSPDMQKGIIAHEATHFSQNHFSQRLKLQHAVNMTSILPLVLPLLELEPSYLSSHPATCLITSLLLSYMKEPLGLILSQRHEKEADLLQKTPEELFGLMKYFFHNPFFADDKKRIFLINNGCSAILSEKQEDRPVASQKLLGIPKIFNLLLKITAGHPPSCERVVYLANQFEEQVLNPKTDDIPTSIEECTEALSCYFEKEEDYQTGTPNIDHPLVFKRVDFLRAKLIEFEKNSELSTNS